MWDLIVSVPDHCLSFYFAARSLSASLTVSLNVFIIFLEIFFCVKIKRFCSSVSSFCNLLLSTARALLP